MNRVIAIFIIIGILICAVPVLSMAQEAAAPSKTDNAVTRAPRANFGIVTGKVSKIDSSDPNNPKMVVVSDADNTTHTISITPWTNINKATDISEIKVGDSIRVMSRKLDDKEVAMGIMFGKLRRTPAAQPQSAVAAQSNVNR